MRICELQKNFHAKHVNGVSSLTHSTRHLEQKMSKRAATAFQMRIATEILHAFRRGRAAEISLGQMGPAIQDNGQYGQYGQVADLPTLEPTREKL